MAEVATATPAATVESPPADAALAPIGNIVADAAAPATAPALAVAAVDPAVARTYLAEHGMTAAEAAAIPEADLAGKYDAAKAIEAAKPITYTDFKLPEGVTFDAKLLSDAKALFAAAKLPQDQAQAFVDHHVAAVKASTAASIKAFNDLQAGWQNEVKSDPQIGGANFESKTVPSIAKAIDTFCPDEASRKAFREVVSLTGIGNNPHYVRFMARLGASLMEGEPLGGKPVTRGPRSFEQMAENLFPNQSK